jgi:PAS domain S-box-containing protein
MARKERKKEQKRTKPNAEKGPVTAKKKAVPKTAKRETRVPKPSETEVPISPVVDCLSAAHLGICLFNRDDTITHINQHFSMMTGLEPEKLAGKKLRKNALWGARGQEDEFQQLFTEAKESGKPLTRERLPVSTGEDDQKSWNLSLLPLNDSEAGYTGMYLVIEDVSDNKPRTGAAELMDNLYKSALQHNEVQGLLDDLVDVLKDFSRCSYVKIALIGSVGGQVLRAETGREPGLWDTDQTLSADIIASMFKGNGSEASTYKTGEGSIYLEDIGRIDDSLEGALSELVTNERNSYGFRSLALVPIGKDDAITGFIQLANKKSGGIPDETLEAVEKASHQLNVILDGIDLKDEVCRQRESLLRQMYERGAHLEALSERLKQEISERKKAQEEMRVQRDLAVELNGIDNMDEALQLCLDTAIRVSGADSGGIYILDRQTGDLTLLCSKGLSSEFTEAARHYDSSTPNFQIVEGMKPIYARLDALEPPINDPYVAEGLMGAGIIPIQHNNRVIGCLNVASHVHDEIAVSARNALETVSAQIGSVITRIQGRKDLEDSEERYRTLFARSANPILIADFDGKYLDGNDAALAFLECTREELLAMHVRDTLPPYLDEQWFEHYRSTWETGGTIERDYYVWGKIKVMEMTITPVQFGGSRLVFGIGKDITERKRVEMALRVSEEKYRQHFNNVSDVIYALDCEFKVVDVSPSVERVLGYKPEELSGRHFAELNVLSAVSMPMAYENLKTIIAGGRVESSEYQFIAKDRRIIYGEVSGAPLYHEDKLIGIVSVARDITERKKAEAALNESEERYRLLAENIMDTVFLMDMNFHIVWVTPSGKKTSGFTVEEMKSLPPEKRIAPGSLQKVTDMYVQAMDDEASGTADPHRVYTVDLELLRKDGSTFWAENRFQFMRDENGKAVSILAEGRDITERKRAEEALRASEEMFKNIVEHSSDIFFVQDRERRFKYLSPQIESTSGYSREELSSRWRDLLTDNPVNLEGQKYVETALRTGEKQPVYKYEFGKRDGGTILFEINETPVKDLNGDVVGFVGVARDITEHDKIEKALIGSEAKYRSLVESGGAGIATVDIAGQITFANDALCQMTGYSKEEVRMKQFMDFVHPEDMENTIKLFTEGVEGKRRTSYVQFRLICKDGKARWFYTNPTEIVLNGQIVGFTAILQDITERKNTEQALRESEEKYRSVVENANEGILVIQDGQFKYANDRLIGFSKYTREEARQIAADPFGKLLYPDDREMVLQNYLKRRNGEPAPTQYEFRWVDKDGWLRWADVRVSEFLWEGKPASLSFIMDITDRKRSEQALAESEEKFKDLADLLPQVVFEADAEGIFTYVNKSGYEVFGYTPDEVIGQMNVSDVIIPAERERVLKNYFDVLAGETTAGNEYTATRKDGSTFNAIVFTNSIIEGDKAVGLRGAFTDISLIVKAESALRESEEKYRSVVENAGEAIYIAQDGKVKFANQRTFEIVHYTQEELLSRPFAEVIHPDDREMVVQRYKQRLQGEQLLPLYSFRIVDKDGTIKWFELRVNPIQWEGRPATLNFVTDITDRKQAEQALKESEERYRLLADNSLDVIWTADMEGKISYVSPSIRYLVGHSSEEIMNMYRRNALKADFFGVSEEDGGRFMNGLSTLSKDPSRTLSFEFELKHADGFTSWVEVKMSIMRDQNGQAAGILGIVRDITQQKKMTERLVSADRLASLGEMAAGLAHEVNNPLTAVMGFAYLLQQNPNTSPEIKNDVEAIYREGKRAAEVIKSFLIFARGQKPEKQAIYINDILEAVMRLRRSQMNKENIEVTSSLEDDLPAVQGDVSQLQQAFLNIVLNAEYFMYKSHRGGHLSLSSTIVDGKIKVLIGDDGPGIPPEKLNRVFDPFYTTKDVGEGTGLGLSICHGIIREHGGDIYVESNAGRGATFIVELPVRN